MATYTQLSATATPMRRLLFLPKSPAPVWMDALIDGIDMVTGKIIKIQGRIKLL